MGGEIMRIISYKGKSQKVSKEFIRAWIQASASVLAFHKMPVTEMNIKILPKTDPSMQNNPLTGGNNGGWYQSSTNTIALADWIDKENLATIILHEMIHAGCGDFGEGTNEKCTSTLTGKLKPTVSIIAQTLLEATYRNAAYIALTRKTKNGVDMHYRAKDGDFYDDSQWIKTEPTDKYKKSVMG